MNGSTGLGLFIAQRIITSMGGILQVESAPGRGTKFSFELIVLAAEDAEAMSMNIGENASLGSMQLAPDVNSGSGLQFFPTTNAATWQLLLRTDA